MKTTSRFVTLALVGALALAAVPLAQGWAQGRAAPFTVVETGQSFARLQDAVNAIGDARGTIAVAPGRYAQCAVQERGFIAFKAAEPGSVVFDGVTCEGKAALVLRGRGAEVSGIVFQNMRVPDFNGSGIRLEQSDLTVSQSWFRDSQQGILTNSDPAARLAIDRSTFSRLGTCEGSGGCAHSVYTGEYGELRITRSRFEEGVGGHYVKTRGVSVAITNNSFDDSRGRATNYMIDLSAGAGGEITGNWFVQGADKDNHSTFIAVAPETQWHSSADLLVAGNTARLATGVSRRSTFVRDWSGDMDGIGENALGRGLAAFARR